LTRAEDKKSTFLCLSRCLMKTTHVIVMSIWEDSRVMVRCQSEHCTLSGLGSYFCSFLVHFSYFPACK